MSARFAKVLAGAVKLLTSPMKRYSVARTRASVSEQLLQVWPVETRYGLLKFYCPSGRSIKRAAYFFRQEPQIVEWINTMVQRGDVIWDIGANIGVYSLYAALRTDITVLAFEPSAQTFAVLVKNIEINKLGERVHAYCIALDKTTRPGSFHLSHTAPGHARHAFGVPENLHGVFQPEFSHSMLAFSVDDFCRIFKVRKPDHIKLDVDGNEADILKGSKETLKGVRSVLVEMADNNEVVAGGDVAQILESHGFRLDNTFTSRIKRDKLFVKNSSRSVK